VARLLPEVRPEDGGPTAAEGESPRLLEEGIAQLMMTLAGQRPLCLFLDDLQWADKATGQLLHYLAHQTRTARVLLIGAYREGEVAGSDWLRGWLTEVEAQRMATSLPLARLNEEEVASLLKQLAEDQASETLLRPLAERLHKETEGNPLFLLETVRDLFERGYLIRNEEGRWRIASEKLAQSGTTGSTGKTEEGVPLAWRLPIPETVQRVVRQRVARLREEDRQLLQCAAVIGRRFIFPELQRAVDGPMDLTMEGVERLMTADLITARGQPAALDFTHDKIREVVYGDLVSIRRQELHRRVGEAIEAVYGIAGASVIEDEPYPTWSRRPPPPPARARAEEHAEELARHFNEAAPLIGPERAVCYCYLAGTRARALCAYEQAVSNLFAAKSLLMLGELPPNASRLAQLGQIVEQLAPAYRSTFQRDLAQQLLRDYIDLCEQRDYGRGIARGCTLMGLFLELNPAVAEAITSESMYERAIAVCEANGLHDWVAYPSSLLAWRLVYTGVDVDRAETLVRSSLSLAEASQDKRLLLSLYTTRMWVATARADWEELKKAFRNSLACGGLAQVHLHMLLTKMEGTCYQLSTESAFRQLCRDIADAYTRMGMESPVQQWYLAPTTPRVRPGELVVREEFDGEDWDPALIWHDVTGRSRLERAIRPGWLGLYPALDADLWPEINLAAPRLLAPVAGDFVAQTRVELGASRDVYAGLLLWQDEQHFVRLEMHRVPGQEKRAGIDLSACVRGRFRSVGRGQCERRPIWLRLERMGEWLHGLCSADGEHWLACGSVLMEPGKEESVGLLAHTQFPGDQAWFDSLLLWRGLRH
jgi:regulation of enolase protein 1 (concanavalin A-like superfamily)